MNAEAEYRYRDQRVKEETLGHGPYRLQALSQLKLKTVIRVSKLLHWPCLGKYIARLPVGWLYSGRVASII